MLTKHVLSYGGGVDSTALFVLLKYVEKVEFKAIFVNTQCEKPETIEYVHAVMMARFDNITELVPNVRGHANLYDYCMDKKFVPSIANRWCTCDSKLKAINLFLRDNFDKGDDVTIHIGIGWYEKERINQDKKTKYGFVKRYLLDEYNYTRADCISLIREYDLPVPMKSSCFFCPFQKKNEAREYFDKHEDLALKTIALEDNCKYPDMKLIGGRYSLREILPLKTKKLFEYMDEKEVINHDEDRGE